MTASIAVPVFATKFARGWPEHAAGEPAKYIPLGDALTTQHDSDAHVACYSVPEIARRLAGEFVFAEIDRGVPMALFLVDVEPEGHAPVTAEWWKAERQKLDWLLADHEGGFIYRTRGGYRIVYRLESAFVLMSTTDASRWKATYLAWLEHVEFYYGIRGDRSCQDWTRLYRLPRVVRDGQRQELEVIGDPTAIGSWNVEVEIPEPPAPKPRAPRVYASEGDFDLDDFMARAYPGVECKTTMSGRRWDVECPWKHEHSSESKRETSVFWYSATGAHEFICLHGHCKGHRHWKEFRRWHQPEWIPFDERVPLTVEQKASHIIEQKRRQQEREERDPAAPEDAHPKPASSDPAPSDPWTEAVEQARADITAKLGAQRGKRSRLFVDVSEVLGAQYADQQWRVTGLIPSAGSCAIAGEPKSATKTWMLLEIAIAVATGTLAFNEFTTTRGRVAYFFAEDTPRSVRNRSRALLANRETPLEPGYLHVQPRGEFIDVLSDDDLACIVASCRELGGVDVLILDPLRDVHSGEEDKGDSMRDVMRRLRLLGELLGCVVITAHHVAKWGEATKARQPGQRMRGSSAIHAAIDAGIYVSQAEGDGRCRFVNTVDSEVKSARGDGRFTTQLLVRDDELGEAVSATWTVSREAGARMTAAERKEEAKREAHAGDDAVMLAFVRRLAERGEYYSKTALRRLDQAELEAEEPPISSEPRRRSALQRLIDAGSLVEMGGKVCLPKPRRGVNP